MKVRLDVSISWTVAKMLMVLLASFAFNASTFSLIDDKWYLKYCIVAGYLLQLWTTGNQVEGWIQPAGSDNMRPEVRYFLQRSAWPTPAEQWRKRRQHACEGGISSRRAVGLYAAVLCMNGIRWCGILFLRRQLMDWERIRSIGITAAFWLIERASSLWKACSDDSQGFYFVGPALSCSKFGKV